MNNIPKTASQTFRGQKLLKSIISPIPYSGSKPINENTQEEFNITPNEIQIYNSK